MTDSLGMLDEWLDRIAPIGITEQSVGHRDFADEVRERMETGRRTYGDRSFELTFAQLMAEARMEAVDLAGWPYIAWRKLRLWEAELPDGHELRQQLENALDGIEMVGWYASLVWTRLGQLVDEVADMTKTNNDHEQDGS